MAEPYQLDSDEDLIDDQTVASYVPDDNTPQRSYDIKVFGPKGGEQKLLPYVNESETSGAADIVTYVDQCGREEADAVSAGNVQHKINGIFYKSVVQQLYEWYTAGERVTISLPANIGTVDLYITDITVTQTSENGVFVDKRSTEYDVYPTQIQLKASRSEQ